MITAMEAIVRPAALHAIMDLAAAPRGAATQYGFHGSPVAGRDKDFGGISLGHVISPVRLQNIGEMHSWVLFG